MRFFLVFFCLLTLSALSAQNEEAIALIRDGIALHDGGDYDAAIMRYEQALEIDPELSMAMYEIGYSYMAKGDTKKARKWMKKVIKADADFANQAYQVLGSILDDAGKAKKAIKVFEEGIEKFPEDHLLFYNLALTYARLEDWENTAATLEGGLNADPTHESSLALMASAQEELGNRVKSLLAAYLFLFLEPDSQRAGQVVDLTVRNVIPDIEEDGDGNYTLAFDPEGEGAFSTADLAMNMAAASVIEAEGDVTAGQLFAAVNSALFGVLLQEAEGKEGIWWEWFAFFYGYLHEAGHTEAFSYYIWQSRSEEEIDWMNTHEPAMTDFFNWIENL